jgi:hypothetical protein
MLSRYFSWCWRRSHNFPSSCFGSFQNWSVLLLYMPNMTSLHLKSSRSFGESLIITRPSRSLSTAGYSSNTPRHSQTRLYIQSIQCSLTTSSLISSVKYCAILPSSTTSTSVLDNSLCSKNSYLPPTCQPKRLKLPSLQGCIEQSRSRRKTLWVSNLFGTF